MIIMVHETEKDGKLGENQDVIESLCDVVVENEGLKEEH